MSTDHEWTHASTLSQRLQLLCASLVAYNTSHASHESKPAASSQEGQLRERLSHFCTLYEPSSAIDAFETDGAKYESKAWEEIVMATTQLLQTGWEDQQKKSSEEREQNSTTSTEEKHVADWKLVASLHLLRMWPRVGSCFRMLFDFSVGLLCMRAPKNCILY